MILLAIKRNICSPRVSLSTQVLCSSFLVLQVNFTSSKQQIMLEVSKPEVTSISLLLPLLFYFRNTKKIKTNVLDRLIPGIRTDRSYSSLMNIGHTSCIKMISI